MPDTSQHDSSDDKKKVSTNIGEQHLQAIKAMKYLQPIIQIILYIPNTHAPWMRGGSVLISHSWLLKRFNQKWFYKSEIRPQLNPPNTSGACNSNASWKGLSELSSCSVQMSVTSTHLKSVEELVKKSTVQRQHPLDIVDEPLLPKGNLWIKSIEPYFKLLIHSR